MKPYGISAVESVTLTLPSSAAYYTAAPTTAVIPIVTQRDFERALALVPNNADLRNSARGLEVCVNTEQGLASPQKEKKESGGGDDKRLCHQ